MLEFDQFQNDKNNDKDITTRESKTMFEKKIQTMITPNVIARKKQMLEVQKRSVKAMRNSAGKTLLLLYWNKSGNPAKNFNGRVITQKGVRLVCTHYAWKALKLNFNNIQNAFKNSEEILKHDDLKNNELKHDRILFSRKFYHLFDLEDQKGKNNFGKKLHDIAKTIEVGKQQKILILSENHAMSAIIRCKEKKDKYAGKYYVIKFYEPNKTKAYLRVVSPNLKNIKALSIKHLLAKQEQKYYFPQHKSIMFCSAEACAPEEKPQVILESRCDDTKLSFSIALGLSENVRDLCQKVLESDISSEKMFDKLSAKNHSKTPSLHSALHYGHTETVKFFLEAVLNSTLTHEQKVTLLAAKCDAGTPGIYSALKNKKNQTIDAFINTILMSSLSNKHKLLLLDQAFEDTSTKASDWISKNAENSTKNLFVSELEKQRTELMVKYLNTILTSGNHNYMQKHAVLKNKLINTQTGCRLINAVYDSGILNKENSLSKAIEFMQLGLACATAATNSKTKIEACSHVASRLQIKNIDSTAVNNMLRDIKATLAIRRNGIHFWATPRSYEASERYFIAAQNVLNSLENTTHFNQTIFDAPKPNCGMTHSG